MRIIVDLIRCQSYGQCVFAAPTVFRFSGEHALVSGERGLEFDYAPDDALREQVVARRRRLSGAGHSHRPTGRAGGVAAGRHGAGVMSATAADGVFSGRIVIVGASLAGLRAAEALRLAGFTGPLTLIGDEPYPPYDRPPLRRRS